MKRSIESLLVEAAAEARATEGWDFSSLARRRSSEEPPWSYEEALLPLCTRAGSMLDMDTGGGERLSALRARCERWPRRVCATEAYPPNVALARRNLEPIGVEVRAYEEPRRLPFEAGAFDLIANRHGSYAVEELGRLLRAPALFITEQVGSDMCMGLNRLLGAPAAAGPRWDLAQAATQLEAAGFELIERREHHGFDRFADIGAVVWYLTKVPWQIPDFSIERYRRPLLELHASIEERGPIDVGNHHFLIVARGGESGGGARG